MICDERIDFCEGIDFNKTSESKELGIYHYCYVGDIAFKFQAALFSECHDVLMSMSLSDIVILNIHVVGYSCIVSVVSKIEAKSSMQNLMWVKNVEYLRIFKNEQKNLKFGDNGMEKHKLHQHKSSVSINKIDLNKIVACNEVCFSKKDFKYFLVIKMVKKLDLYVYCFQKWMHMDMILIRLNIYLFYRRWWIVRSI